MYQWSVNDAPQKYVTCVTCLGMKGIFVATYYSVLSKYLKLMKYYILSYSIPEECIRVLVTSACVGKYISNSYIPSNYCRLVRGTCNSHNELTTKELLQGQ